MTNHNGQLTLTLPEEFDAAAAENADDYVDQHIEAGMTLLQVDMTKTKFIDSTGIGLVVYAARRAQKAGLAVKICCPQNQPRELMRTLRLDKVFEFVDTLQA